MKKPGDVDQFMLLLFAIFCIALAAVVAWVRGS